jgi:hypothetical protein
MTDIVSTQASLRARHVVPCTSGYRILVSYVVIGTDGQSFPWFHISEFHSQQNWNLSTFFVRAFSNLKYFSTLVLTANTRCPAHCGRSSLNFSQRFRVNGKNRTKAHSDILPVGIFSGKISVGVVAAGIGNVWPELLFN